MKLLTLILTAVIPYYSSAQSSLWSAIKISKAKQESSNIQKIELRNSERQRGTTLYIETDLLNRLIMEGRVLTKETIDSMNCGGGDCTIAQ